MDAISVYIVCFGVGLALTGVHFDKLLEQVPALKKLSRNSPPTREKWKRTWAFPTCCQRCPTPALTQSARAKAAGTISVAVFPAEIIGRLR